MSARQRPIRVLCADDHRIVREGLALVIGRQPDMEIVGSAASGPEAVELFRRLLPDVTLMDLQLGSTMSGVDAIRAIKRESPQAAIVVLTIFQGDEDIYRALEAGATAYLLKDSLSDDLARTVRQVHDGENPMSPDIVARLAERAAGPTLTRREVQVIELVSQGMHNKEVAAALGISEETVHVHVRHILSKLRVKDRCAAITAALRRGIIHLRY
jgi:two-component system NarL family response regulator